MGKRKNSQTLGMSGPGGAIPFGAGPVFHQDALSPVFCLTLMKVGVVYMSELPDLLSLDAEDDP
jgi:hypothetical protein